MSPDKSTYPYCPVCHKMYASVYWNPRSPWPGAGIVSITLMSGTGLYLDICYAQGDCAVKPKTIEIPRVSYDAFQDEDKR